MTTLQAQIEERLADSAPDVEVLLAELVGGTVRVFIDHPAGVTVDLCERVTRELGDVRERYGLEVSSPGVERPLTKPAHFSRYVGRHVRLRMTDGGTGGKASLAGELLGADDSGITLAAPDGMATIPYSAIRRCNLLED
ncbi:MAG TPA: ribosome maturation factor RimP [Solirubrobacteraceae bacterium]|jgi:ribosome maturation factor RimP|nr:ribosome maturation factor RimP [Solirubrobacteraceae bacterium]